ncbi:MAG: hypothetical protein DSM106950_34765 [Stigonema ocellatum SAG 48.90 = DSM 106950]|nr:hypothetical protein [Stigonema ocellatum SAG 48.90 = DSM 106950]
MGSGEWGMGNGEWGVGNGEWGIGSGDQLAALKFKIQNSKNFLLLTNPKGGGVGDALCPISHSPLPIPHSPSSPHSPFPIPHSLSTQFLVVL